MKTTRFLSPRLRVSAVMLLVLCMALLVGSTSGGCETFSADDRQAMLEQSAELQAAAAAQRDQQVAELERATAAGDEHAAEQARKAIALLDKLQPMLASGHAVFEASVAADGSVNISPAAMTIGTAVGGPVGTGIAIGLPLLWGALAQWGRQRKVAEAKENLDAAVSMVKLIDRASIANPETNRALNEAWPMLEGGLTPVAAKLVDEHSVT